MLTHLDEKIGARGMATVPGLTAAVDQHAAAVRDILVVGVEGSTGVGPVLLAGYARGLLDHAKEQDWPVGVGMLDWLNTRLLAVCELARRLDEPRANLEPLC